MKSLKCKSNITNEIALWRDHFWVGKKGFEIKGNKNRQQEFEIVGDIAGRITDTSSTPGELLLACDESAGPHAWPGAAINSRAGGTAACLDVESKPKRWEQENLRTSNNKSP